MEIKIATIKDLQVINDLYYSCSENMKEQFGLNHWENPYPQDVLAKRIVNELVYIVLDSDEFIGTFMLENEYPAPYLEAIEVDDNPFRYLTRLAVSPQLQSKGVGSAIMQEAEKISSDLGADVLRLDILGHYEKLQQFYEKNGYQVIGEGKTRRFSIKFMEKNL